MRFTPTLAQLELLVDLQTAKMPLAVIAARLGVDEAAFKAWMARLDIARDYVEPTQSSEEILRELWANRPQAASGRSRHSRPIISPNFRFLLTVCLPKRVRLRPRGFEVPTSI
jgi:hypothetical protein